jgi:xanthine dehydrogenase YagS FAD-binding subunit
MQNFEYGNPTTLQAAFALLGSNWNDAAVLAGGTDLISMMKDHVYAPKRVVNIKSIKQLSGISAAGGGLRIGATATVQELLDSQAVRTQYPSLAAAARGITSPQIRNMGTVGGDLCQRPRCWYFRQGHGLLARDAQGKSLVPEGQNRYHAIFGSGPAYFVSASSFGPPLVALAAKMKVSSASGSREIDAEKFFVAPPDENTREIALQPNEILTEIIIPAAGGRNATYEVRERMALDWPLATASVVLGPKGASRVVLGHVAPTPWVAKQAEQFLAGKTVNEQVAEEAGKLAAADAKPLSDNGYKVQLVRVAVKRALLEAAKAKA